MGRVQAHTGAGGPTSRSGILGSSPLRRTSWLLPWACPMLSASHFAPAELDRALEIYPRAVQAIGPNGSALCDARHERHCRRDGRGGTLPLHVRPQQAFVNLRSGRPGPLPRPGRRFNAEALEPAAQAILAHTLTCAVVGSPDTVRKGLAAFQARTERRPPEIIVTAPDP